MTYIHELTGWPDLIRDDSALAQPLAAVRHRQGGLIRRMEALGIPRREEAVLRTLTKDVLKSSEIEGEVLDRAQVRFSIARRLGMDVVTGPPGRPEAIGFCIGSSDPVLFEDALRHGTLSAAGPADLDDALMIYWFRRKSDHDHAFDFIGTIRRASVDEILEGKFRASPITVGR